MPLPGSGVASYSTSSMIGNEGSAKAGPGETSLVAGADGALARALARRGIEMVVLAGTLTNVCVDSTAREANMRGYKVLIAADACSAVTDTEQDAALLNLRLNFADVKSCAQVLEMTKGAAP